MMNIKSISHTIIQSTETKGNKETKTFEADKDKDPQQGFTGGQSQEEAFTEEDIQKAKEYLEAHPGIKKNNLKVFLEKKNEAYFFVIKDYTSKVVRKLSLWDAIQSSRQAINDTNDQRGGILNKAV